jgi:hypothetical protein
MDALAIRLLRVLAIAASSLAGVLASGCNAEPSPEATPEATTAASTASATTTGAETAPEATTGGEMPEPLESFNRREFARSTRIDNEWFPLRPGTQYVYKGSTVEGGSRVPHRVVFTVTELTKVIAGVRASIVWDRDYSADRLVEAELAFFAQDDDGTVWQLGQYPEEYEEGKLVDAPAWITGFENARAGIVMKPKPRRGTPSYSQGWGPAVNWTDRARVARMGQRTCVPAGCFNDVLIMEEFSREEPDAFQLKYYARGVGNVRVGWRGEDPSKEVLVLTEVVQLGPESLAEVRAGALRLERRAYRISEDVYGRTPPAEGP